MSTERSDYAYGVWQQSSEKFDYFVTGLRGALAAYIAQTLTPARIGLNPETAELIALILIAGSVVAGFKRIEATVHLYRLSAQQSYAQEVAGSSMAGTKNALSINTKTGEVFTPAQLLARAEAFGQAAKKLDPHLDKAKLDATSSYHARNRMLLTGFVLLLAGRVWSAY